MLALTHAVIGAAGGEFIKNAPLAFMAGVILHFIFDKVPHYFPKAMVNKTRFALADWLLAVVFIFGLRYFSFSAGAIWGAIGGFAVDPILVGIPFLKNSKLGIWHIERQKHLHEIPFIFIDLLILAVAVSILIVGKK